MATERPLGIENPAFRLNTDLLRRPKDIVFREVARAGGEMIDFQDPYESIDEFYFLRQNRFPIVYATHESHVDEEVLVKAVDRMNKVGNPHIDFNLPLAISLLEGKQSSMLTNYYLGLKPYMEKHRIHPIEVAREVDTKDHGFKRTVKEYIELMKTPMGERGVVAFPQARVMSGRVDSKTGKRIGMIKVDNTMLPELVRRSITRAHKDVAFLPIGIHGTFKIYDPGVYDEELGDTIPGTARVTPEAWKALALQKVGIKKKLATAVVGEPFTFSDLYDMGISFEDPEALNDALMRRVAELVPEEARGYYS